jgi:XTP/dITP diphosphohydrolase
MIDLVFCSSNVHKSLEMSAILPSWISVRSMRQVGIMDDIPETGTTFLENALAKARFVHERTGMSVFADDSGLEVACLGGQPGVRTARFAGEGATSKQNMEKLLHDMRNCREREARFVCCIALIFNNEEVSFEGVVDGHITNEILGEGGFGYDPIFVPKGYGSSFSELPMDTKNSVSHRYNAVRQMVDWLGANT